MSVLIHGQRYVRLQLLTAERAWANAMAVKAAHSADTKGISGKTRSHIVSRLDKGAKAAENLVEALSESAVSGASETDILEARAYAALLRGAELFEKQSWDSCLKNYSTARIIYIALTTSTKGDTFKELVSETIDPSIRYAAYQLKIPRTQPIPAIARKAFRHSDSDLVQSINKLNPNVLKQGGQEDPKQGFSGDGAPATLTWRTREVKIEDAAISVAWAAVQTAKSGLADKLAPLQNDPPKDQAGAYDDILIAAQDAVDATKQAIDELKAEGVPQSDSRMQSLQITRTAVNYEMISWRIGRNRVLMGEQDGATIDAASSSRRKKASKDGSDSDNRKEEAPGRQIARLKEKVVLYDGTLQSLESIKELPGVAADQDLAAQLDATVKYFTALKYVHRPVSEDVFGITFTNHYHCRSLAIARSHSLAGNVTNALALTKYAHDHSKEALPILSKGEDKTTSASSPRNIVISRQYAEGLDSLLTGEFQRSRALVEIANLRKATNVSGAKGSSVALAERLAEYPSEGVDLENIVVYPPKLELIPVKPIFLDVAWNYIDYPGKQAQPSQPSKQKGAEGSAAAGAGATAGEEAKPQKRGWFGFGR